MPPQLFQRGRGRGAGSPSSLGPPSPFSGHVSFSVDCCFSFTLAIFTGFHESVKVTGVKGLCNCQVGLTAPTAPPLPKPQWLYIIQADFLLTSWSSGGQQNTPLWLLLFRASQTPTLSLQAGGRVWRAEQEILLARPGNGAHPFCPHCIGRGLIPQLLLAPRVRLGHVA